MQYFLILRTCPQALSLKMFRRAIVTVVNSEIASSLHLLKSNMPISCQVRTFWETFPQFRPLYHKKDGLSRDKYELIYRARIFGYAFYAQILSMATLTTQFFVGVYFTYKSFQAGVIVPMVTEMGPFVVNYNMKTAAVFGILMFQNALMYVAAQTACFRIYYCEESDKYVFVSLSLNPFKSRLTYCNSGELIPLKESMINIFFGNHILGYKRFFVNYSYFKHFNSYSELVGGNYTNSK